MKDILLGDIKGRASYRHGYKYCQNCGLFLKVNSLRCPFCNQLLRTTPKKRKRCKS